MKQKSEQKRRRNQESYQAIISATLELLKDKGYVKLSIEGIAARAGVGKQTIYRWWPSKAALVIEAYSKKVSDRYALPETGSVKGDLEQLLSSIFKNISKTPSSHVLTGLIAEAQTNPDIADQFFNDFIQPRRRLLTEIIEGGVERGEIKASVEIPVVADMLFGAMWYRLLIGHGPLNREFAEKLVGDVLAGIALNRQNPS